MVGIGLEKDRSCCKERGISHDGKWTGNIRDLEYRSGGKDLFELLKGSLLKGGPFSWFVLPSKEIQRCYNVRKVGDEFLVEIGKSCEGLDPFHCCGGFPLFDCLKFLLVHLHLSLAYN